MFDSFYFLCGKNVSFPGNDAVISNFWCWMAFFCLQSNVLAFGELFHAPSHSKTRKCKGGNGLKELNSMEFVSFTSNS